MSSTPTTTLSTITGAGDRPQDTGTHRLRERSASRKKHRDDISAPSGILFRDELSRDCVNDRSDGPSTRDGNLENARLG